MEQQRPGPGPAAAASLLAEDVLALLFRRGGLGQRELGRAGCVCREWRAASRAGALWLPLLRELLRCFGSDPFGAAPPAAIRSAAAGGGEAWFALHRLLFVSLRARCRDWLESLGAKERRRHRTLWDVLCCCSPLERYCQLQRRRGGQRGEDVALWASLADPAAEADEAARLLHGGSWEARRRGQPDGPWAPVLPRDQPPSPAGVLVHFAMDWLLCQQHDPHAREPQPGRVATAYCQLLAAAAQQATHAFAAARPPLPHQLWLTDISAAGDCLLGLHPSSEEHAVAREAIAAFVEFEFRLAQPCARLPAALAWAPLCSLAAQGVAAADSDVCELGAAPQPVAAFLRSPKGTSAVARANARRQSAAAASGARGAGGGRTVYLQALRVTSSSQVLPQVDAAEIERLSGYLQAWFTGCSVAVLDHAPLQLAAAARQLRRTAPQSLVAFTRAVHGYDMEVLPQLSADAVISKLHATVLDQRSGKLLVPGAMAVLGVVGVDLFSARRPLCSFLWSHSMTAQHQAHPKSEGVGIALGCLSLARGGGGAHDDMGYGRCGTCALAKQAVRVLCDSAFGLAPCTVARCVLNPASADAELLASPPQPCAPCLDKLVAAGALARGKGGARAVQALSMARWFGDQDEEALGRAGQEELRWLKLQRQ